jgi:predicted DNA-binding protein (MmcQ/YjbR family)
VNLSTVRPERLARLRAICLALPEASEKMAWGDPTFRVRDKIFAMQKGNYAGGRPSVWIKGGEGAQAMLVESDPGRFFVPPYVGNKGWIGIYLDRGAPDWSMLRDLVLESYRLIAPARLTRPLTPADSPRRPTRAKARAKPRTTKAAR